MRRQKESFESMLLKIITTDRLKLSAEVEEVMLPAVSGAVQVLNNHAASIIMLKDGDVVYDNSLVKIAGGVAKVDENLVVIFEREIRAPLI